MADRPVQYSDDLADRLCELIASTSRSVRSICEDEDWAPAERTFYRWVLQREDFGQKYARAKETQAERFAEELIDIVDDGRNDFVERESQRGTFIALNDEAIQRSRLRYDARRWLMSKMKPKKYGDKIEHTGANGEPLIPPVLNITLVPSKS